MLKAAWYSAAVQQQPGDREGLAEMQQQQTCLAPSLLHVGAAFPCRHSLWVVARVRLQLTWSWPWPWPWPIGTDIPHGVRAAWSLKTCLAIRHPGHYPCPSPSLLVGYCGAVRLGELLLCWPSSPLPPGFLPNLIIPWYLRACVGSVFKTETKKKKKGKFLVCDLISKLKIRTDK